MPCEFDRYRLHKLLLRPARRAIFSHRDRSLGAQWIYWVAWLRENDASDYKLGTERLQSLAGLCVRLGCRLRCPP
jgi:hypothetical protein